MRVSVAALLSGVGATDRPRSRPREPRRHRVGRAPCWSLSTRRRLRARGVADVRAPLGRGHREGSGARPGRDRRRERGPRDRHARAGAGGRFLPRPVPRRRRRAASLRPPPTDGAQGQGRRRRRRADHDGDADPDGRWRSRTTAISTSSCSTRCPRVVSRSGRRRRVPTRSAPPPTTSSGARFGAGRQAFVVCAAIDEGNRSQVRAAEAEAERLATEIFPDLHVELLHGRMRPKDKDRVMEAFRTGLADAVDLDHRDRGRRRRPERDRDARRERRTVRARPSSISCGDGSAAASTSPTASCSTSPMRRIWTPARASRR